MVSSLPASSLLQSNGHCLLLFLTICFMTSGHFLSSNVYQQHHSNRRYQQQQEKYHYFPNLSPAVSQLHFQPHKHVIIRRASLPQKQQHSPYAKDYSTTPPAIALMKKIDMLQIDEELKALKKKRKRLRQLREEVRELSDHLKSKRTFSKSKLLFGPETSNSDLLAKHKMKEAHVRWRKQITTRVKAIMKRLKRLENEMKTERNFTKERKKLAKRLPLVPLNFHALPSSPHTLLITTTKNVKIKRLHSSINQSKNGESGGICLGHNDCKPGLCCHRISSMDANSSIASTVSLCYQYMLKDGELCEDSCQCEAQLHCFRSSNQLKSGKSMAKSKRNMVLLYLTYYSNEWLNLYLLSVSLHILCSIVRNLQEGFHQ
uniref:PAPA-1 domain-containing protein n=1 Tax=Elaeophora elaphi TaxID=1147741 RepID=A0A0R3S0P4_9BILA